MILPAPPAQAPYPEANVRRAFARLAEAGGISLRLDATERIGLRTTTSVATVKWLNAPPAFRDCARVEMVVWENDRMTRRIVMDGRTVWNYDPATNSYTAQTIDDGRGPKAPAGYRRNLDALLTEAAPGPTGDALRLARELLGDPMGANYRSWMPGVRPTDGGPGAETWAIYDLPSGDAKRVTFALDPAPEGDSDERPIFASLTRAATVRTGRTIRTLTETVRSLAEPLDPSNPAFVFSIPPGAVSVAPTRRVRF